MWVGWFPHLISFNYGQLRGSSSLCRGLHDPRRFLSTIPCQVLADDAHWRFGGFVTALYNPLLQGLFVPEASHHFLSFRYWLGGLRRPLRYAKNDRSDAVCLPDERSLPRSWLPSVAVEECRHFRIVSSWSGIPMSTSWSWCSDTSFLFLYVVYFAARIRPNIFQMHFEPKRIDSSLTKIE